jgi:hypothetical protein
MSKMQKTFGLRDCVSKRSSIVSATYSKPQNSCHLHGMFPKEKVVNESNWLKKRDRSIFYLFLLGDILSTFTIALLTPARGGNRCDSVCSAVHRLTIPLELVSNQPSLSL